MITLQDMLKEPGKLIGQLPRMLDQSMKTAVREIHNLPENAGKIIEDLTRKGEAYLEQSGLKEKVEQLPYYEDIEKLYCEAAKKGKEILGEVCRHIHATDAGKEVESPLEGIDVLGVRKILPLMHDLSNEELEQLKRYETSHGNRVTILREAERILKSRS